MYLPVCVCVCLFSSVQWVRLFPKKKQQQQRTSAFQSLRCTLTEKERHVFVKQMTVTYRFIYIYIGIQKRLPAIHKRKTKRFARVGCWDFFCFIPLPKTRFISRNEVKIRRRRRRRMHCKLESVDVNGWLLFWCVFSVPERKRRDNIHETKPMRERDLSRATLAATTALIIICGFMIGSGIVQFHFNH